MNEPDPTGRLAGEAVLLAASRLTAMIHAAAAAEDLTPLQARFLRTLHDPMPQADLAERLGLDPARVSALTRELGRRGLVEREHGRGDRRRRYARLTREGDAVVDRIGARLTARSPMIQVLDRSERDTLVDLLGRVIAALPGPGADEASASGRERGANRG